MNSQLVIPIAIVILIGIVLAIIFLDRKDKKQFEDQLNEDLPKKDCLIRMKVKSKRYSSQASLVFNSLVLVRTVLYSSGFSYSKLKK